MPITYSPRSPVRSSRPKRGSILDCSAQLTERGAFARSNLSSRVLRPQAKKWQLGERITSALHTPLWLALGWGCRGSAFRREVQAYALAADRSSPDCFPGAQRDQGYTDDNERKWIM